MMAWIRRFFHRPQQPPTPTYDATIRHLREQRIMANAETRRLRKIQGTGNLLADQLQEEPRP